MKPSICDYFPPLARFQRASNFFKASSKSEAVMTSWMYPPE